MAEITRRRTGELLRSLFEILLKYPEGLQARDALAQLEQRVKLTEYESGTFESGGRRFEKVVRLATVDCVKAGMVGAAASRTRAPARQSFGLLGSAWSGRCD